MAKGLDWEGVGIEYKYRSSEDQNPLRLWRILIPDMAPNMQPTGKRDASPVAGRTILLYDGVCALCNRFVRFLLCRDRRKVFYFAPLQGTLAQTILARHGIDLSCTDPSALDTVVLVTAAETPEESLLFRSDAVTEVLLRLGGGWALWARLLLQLPRGLREARYRFIACWRYRIFGKYDTCPLPAPRHRERFLPLE